MTSAEAEHGHDWTALDRRTVVVTAVLLCAAVAVTGVPATIVLADRSALGWVVPGVVLLAALGTAYAWLRWRCARYRVGPVRLELRTGVLVRVRRGLLIESVRSVDTSAGPLLRRFGLVVIRIGTGPGKAETTIRLRAVTRTEGDRLRSVLLDRVRSAGGLPADAVHGRLASIDPRWARYAVLSVATPVLGAAVLAATLLILAGAGALPSAPGWPAAVAPGVRGVLVGVLGLVAVLLAGALVALAVFTERWWNFRLDREPGGTLRVRRGLLYVRSVALEERRLGGVVIVEPLGNRLLGAARLRAVTTGRVTRFDDDATGGATVLPAAPRGLTHRVAAVLLGETLSPTATVALQRHPVAAHRRRVVRACVATAIPVCTLLALGFTGRPVLLVVAGVVALVVLPAGLLIADDAYRALGHGLTRGYLVTRSGSPRRRTVALRCDGITGWTASQSLLQRRAGLITVTGTTTAGAGRVSARDIAESDGLRLAAAAAPDLIRPLLVDVDPVPRPVRDRASRP